MHPFLNIGFTRIPSYGFFIVLGVILANLIGYFLAKKCNREFNDFILIEAYSLLGAVIGSKLLYFIVSIKDIEWLRFFEADYFQMLMQNGFVFFGGLIGGIAFAFLCGKIHKIDIIDYMTDFIFLVPFAHCFGRIGCFMAGCCYGLPYDGPLSVVFPEGSFAISGINLFPVQLIEATLLLLISIIIFFLRRKCSYKHTIALYVILYSIVRFTLEYFRYDAVRGSVGPFSTSQIISIILILITSIYLIINKKKNSCAK